MADEDRAPASDVATAPPRAPTAPGQAGDPDEAPVRPGNRLELYLLRHADAGDPAAWAGDDAARPLSKKGRRQAEDAGRWLRSLGRRMDLIVTSPKLRALETAEIAARHLRLTPTVDDDLAYGGSLEDVAAICAEHPDASRILLVGHDPAFSELASALSGSTITLRKGALARIDVAGSLAPGAGALRWLVPPDAVPAG